MTVLAHASAPDVCGAANAYLAQPRRPYESRAVRYRIAADLIGPLGQGDTVTDLGAGWTEMARCLYGERGFTGRYLPVDQAADGRDLADWEPLHRSEAYVALEIIEHLHDWRSVIARAQTQRPRCIVITTPDADRVDVRAMDPTHVSPVTAADLSALGFEVWRADLYSPRPRGLVTTGRSDALVARWHPGA